MSNHLSRVTECHGHSPMLNVIRTSREQPCCPTRGPSVGENWMNTFPELSYNEGQRN